MLSVFDQKIIGTSVFLFFSFTNSEKRFFANMKNYAVGNLKLSNF